MGSVFHPSDFSEASESAFAHALAAALLGGSSLTILHVDSEGQPNSGWRRFPAVRRTLERWGLLEPGSPRSAVFEQLAVRVRKVTLRSRSPLDACLEYLQDTPTDLIVVATERRSGPPRWLHGSVAEALARESRTMTLFVPQGARGIVSRETGYIDLRRILVAVGADPHPQAAVDASLRIARVAADKDVEIVLFHVGDEALPPVRIPDDPRVSVCNMEHSGASVTEAIIGEADRRAADLVVMTTAGHNSVVDLLRGSTTEQVLRHIECPLLALPAPT